MTPTSWTVAPLKMRNRRNLRKGFLWTITLCFVDRESADEWAVSGHIFHEYQGRENHLTQIWCCCQNLSIKINSVHKFVAPVASSLRSDVWSFGWLRFSCLRPCVDDSKRLQTQIRGQNFHVYPLPRKSSVFGEKIGALLWTETKRSDDAFLWLVDSWSVLLRVNIK